MAPGAGRSTYFNLFLLLLTQKRGESKLVQKSASLYIEGSHFKEAFPVQLKNNFSVLLLELILLYFKEKRSYYDPVKK